MAAGDRPSGEHPSIPRAQTGEHDATKPKTEGPGTFAEHALKTAVGVLHEVRTLLSSLRPAIVNLSESVDHSNKLFERLIVIGEKNHALAERNNELMRDMRDELITTRRMRENGDGTAAH